MRYSQAKELVQSLLEDGEFQELSIDERNAVIERILSDIKGRMMEDIVLLETKIANPKKQVFQLQFAVGEFDMVVADNANATCEIYEVKHSKEQAKEQFRHLIDEEKLKNTEFRYGKITKKSCYLSRRKYDFGKRNRIQERRRLFEISSLKSRSAWFENGTEKARKLKNEKSKRLIKQLFWATQTSTLTEIKRNCLVALILYIMVSVFLHTLFFTKIVGYGIMLL